MTKKFITEEEFERFLLDHQETMFPGCSHDKCPLAQASNASVTPTRWNLLENPQIGDAIPNWAYDFILAWDMEHMVDEKGYYYGSGREALKILKDERNKRNGV